jgi:hypothetical protein
MTANHGLVLTAASTGPRGVAGKYAAAAQARRSEGNDTTKKEQSWEICEFVSYSLKDDDSNSRFTITVSGHRKYRNLLAAKLGDMRITETDLREWVEPGTK